MTRKSYCSGKFNKTHPVIVTGAPPANELSCGDAGDIPVTANSDVKFTADEETPGGTTARLPLDEEFTNTLCHPAGVRPTVHAARARGGIRISKEGGGSSVNICI